MYFNLRKALKSFDIFNNNEGSTEKTNHKQKP